jgi:NAD-dependent deacetylase
MDDALRFAPALIDRLRTAQRVVVLTGAGVSAESGVPTFRDALTGLWAKFDPRELATPSAFARNPKLVWDWYAQRRAQVSTVAPNAGHVALAELEQHVPHFLLITQTVDGLHARAGSRALVELHGNIARVRCSRDDSVVEHWASPSDALPPRCPACGSFLRPDVVWFEEMLPQGALERAQAAACDCDLMIVAGTSGEVYPAAALPHYARAGGARVVEVNPNATPLSTLAHDTLRGASAIVLPALIRAAWPQEAT